jgi:tRNA G18 (ribose-2'-O)-methylase SpoU
MCRQFRCYLKQQLNLYQEKFDAPAVFVVGSEGDGMREKTREHCDFLLKIPLHPRTESLNASVATSIALYAVDEARRRR